ncbi:MAG: SMR-type multi-drug efflux transporter [Modestobacter sp.]|nr:SMR-type multi-drug efflux transporter [Modestobacter sp.]
MAYLMLATAIVAEVAATSLLPRTNGFTVLLPSVLVVVGYAVSFALLAQVVKTLPVGVAYAIWSAVGTLTVVAIGAVFLGQSITGWQGLGVALVVAGVVLLNLGGAAHG